MNAPRSVPPRFSQALLRRVLGQGLVGRSIEGDLQEEYSRRVSSQGVFRAGNWYRREALGVVTRGIWKRISGNDRRSSPAVARPGPVRAMATDLRSDLLHACRILAANPGFAALSVLTLALGIGSSTAIFSVCHAVLIRPLPYPEPDRLVTLWSQEDWQYGTNGPEYFDIRQRQKTLQDIAVHAVVESSLAADGHPDTVVLAAVTGGFFPILGVPPMLGRTFADREDAPGKDDVVVLSHAFWQGRFGGDPATIGRTLSLAGAPVTVIGVMPPGFAFPDDSVDLWTPFAMDPAAAGGRGGHGLQSVARLKPSVSIRQASQDMRRISLQMHEEHPGSYPEQYRSGWTLRLEPLHASLVRNVRTALLVLLGAVGLLLLASCINAAGLLLTRLSSRAPEMAMRLALGAGRGRLLRQLLTESCLLSILGGALGVVLAFWGVGALLELAHDKIPRLTRIGLDWQVLAFALAVSLLTGVLFGLTPAVNALRADLQPTLKRTENRGSPGGRRWGDALVVLETALALLLLLGAGLLMKSFLVLQNVDAGFDAPNVLTFHLKLPATRYNLESALAFYEQLVQQLRSLPGVEEAGAISALPLGKDQSFALLAEGMAANVQGYPHGQISLSSPRFVTHGYFKAMAIRLVEGRFFTDSDRADSLKAALVSDDFARLAWPGEKSVLGKRIAPATRSKPVWFTVVGVTKDVREEAGNLSSERYKDAYFPLAQWPTRNMALTVKTRVEPDSLIDPIRRQVALLDDRLALYDIQTMEEVLYGAVAQPRFQTVLMTLFACMALILSSLGLYGVVSHSVSRRSREIGIRMALGARRVTILGWVVRRGIMPVLAGLALGLVSGLFLAGLLQSLLYGVSPTDWPTYLIVIVALALVALAACLLPARKASRVDPAAALR